MSQVAYFFLHGRLHLLPKDLSFEYGGAKLAPYPGRHLTLLRPWMEVLIMCFFKSFRFRFRVNFQGVGLGFDRGFTFKVLFEELSL